MGSHASKGGVETVEANAAGADAAAVKTNGQVMIHGSPYLLLFKARALRRLNYCFFIYIFSHTNLVEGTIFSDLPAQNGFVWHRIHTVVPQSVQ